VTLRLPRPTSHREALWILLLVLSLCLTVAGLATWQGYRDALQTAHSKAAGAAHVVAAHGQWLFEASRQALRRISDVVNERGGFLSPSLASDLDKAVVDLPGDISVWLVDETGMPRVSNSPAFAAVSVADREYFKALAGGAEWAISSLVTGRTTGRTSFTVGRRLEHDGRFAGVALMVIYADLMADFWRPLDLGPDSSVALLRDDGWIVARYPIPRESADLSRTVLFTHHLPGAPIGTYESERSPTDGVARVVAYRKVPGSNLIAIAAVSTDHVTAAYWATVQSAAWVVIPATLAFLVIIGWLLRQEDLTRRDLARALDENQGLLRELQHRVKNHIQVVSALLKMHAKRSNPDTRRVIDDASRRLDAVASVYSNLYVEGRTVDIAQHLALLCDGFKKAFETPGRHLELAVDVPDRDWTVDHAMPVSLIINELVTNALRHGLKEGGGTIRVDLRTEDGHHVLSVSDSGGPMEKVDLATAGLGFRIIEQLAGQLRGRLDIDPSQSRFTVTFPV
jgi:two-component sensor histidine kinase